MTQLVRKVLEGHGNCFEKLASETDVGKFSVNLLIIFKYVRKDFWKIFGKFENDQEF